MRQIAALHVDEMTFFLAGRQELLDSSAVSPSSGGCLCSAASHMDSPACVRRAPLFTPSELNKSKGPSVGNTDPIMRRGP